MIKRKYPDVVRTLGLQYCGGVNSRGFMCQDFDHRIGEAEPGVVHFLDGRWSWPRMYKLLKLTALARHPDINREPSWRRVWRMSTTAASMGQEARMRVPSKYSAFDRKFVLASVVNVPTGAPDREKAFNWARKVKEFR